VSQPEAMLDLGNGLQIWKVTQDDLREQDLNARSMSPDMMARLVTTIERDKRLESLPLCAVTANGLEIISGHHRVRAARAAGISDLFVLVDTTNLSRDQIKAKQLAHNSIQGTDNQQILEQIYRSIADASARLEAFVPPTIEVAVKPVHVDDVSLDFEYHLLTVMFLPTQAEYFKRILGLLEAQQGEVYLAEHDVFAPFMKALRQTAANYQVRSVGSVLAKMADLVAQHIGADARASDYVALVDLFGNAYVPADIGNLLVKALASLEKQGTITQAARWQALAVWARGEPGGDQHT
jgi:hypothetical protein